MPSYKSLSNQKTIWKNILGHAKCSECGKVDFSVILNGWCGNRAGENLTFHEFHFLSHPLILYLSCSNSNATLRCILYMWLSPHIKFVFSPFYCEPEGEDFTLALFVSINLLQVAYDIIMPISVTRRKNSNDSSAPGNTNIAFAICGVQLFQNQYRDKLAIARSKI